MKALSLIRKLQTEQVPGCGMAAFRVTYSLVLMCEVWHLIHFRHLIFDTIPFVRPYELDFLPALVVWELVLLMLVFGAATRVVVLLNYVLTVVFLSTISSFEYHMMYVYTTVNFLLMFADVSKCFSFDRLWCKLQYSTVSLVHEPTKTVSRLQYLVIPFIAIGVVYIDSVYFKLHSPMWRSGLGVWLPSSLPQVVHVDLSWVLDQKWIILGLGYLTLFFEGLFLFLFWQRSARKVFFVIGVGLHLGILIVYPIPWFALGMLSLYLLLVPFSVWRWIGRQMRCDQPKVTLFYDRESLSCLRTRIVLESFDIRRAIEFQPIQGAKLTKYGLGQIPKNKLLATMHTVDQQGHVRSGRAACVKIFREMVLLFPVSLVMSLPMVSSACEVLYRWIAKLLSLESCSKDNSPLPRVTTPPEASDSGPTSGKFSTAGAKSLAWSGLVITIVLLQLNVHSNLVTRSLVDLSPNGARFLARVSSSLKIQSRRFLGVTAHPLFLDNHFVGYDRIIGVEWEDTQGATIWLPIIDKNGMPGSYNYSGNWANWTFRTNSPNLNVGAFQKRVVKWLFFWGGQNGIDLKKGHFNFYVKAIDAPQGWEAGFLARQKAKPWQKAGTARLSGIGFQFAGVATRDGKALP